MLLSDEGIVLLMTKALGFLAGFSVKEPSSILFEVLSVAIEESLSSLLLSAVKEPSLIDKSLLLLSEAMEESLFSRERFPIEESEEELLLLSLKAVSIVLLQGDAMETKGIFEKSCTTKRVVAREDV